jgi:subtilase family serine protease
MFAYAPNDSDLQRVIVAKAAEYNDAQTVSVSFGTPQIYADLTVTALSTNKSTYNADETVTVTATVKNQGLRSAGGFYVALTSSDLTTQTKYVSSLAAGGSTSVTFTYTASRYTADKTISITATADSTGAVTESNESNNVLLSSSTSLEKKLG